MNIKKYILSLLLVFQVSFLQCSRQKMLIKVPIADLRVKPVLPEYKKNNSDVRYPFYNPFVCDVGDKFQDSQLLLNDKLFFIEFVNKNTNWNNVTDSDWLKVEIAEQKEFKDGEWKNFSGYVQFKDICLVDDFVSSNLVAKKQLVNIYSMPFNSSDVSFKVSIGTKFPCNHVINNDWLSVYYPVFGPGYIKREDLQIVFNESIYSLDVTTRRSICMAAKIFLDSPYSWGGRSSFDENNKNQQTGVDCSSLVNLVYRANGFEVPRNAHDQYEFCNKFASGEEIEAGDLIFFESPKRNARMSHVLMYLGKDRKKNDLIIEVEGYTLLKTVVTNAIERLGKKLSEIKSGQEYNGQVVYFGSFLNDVNKLREMRILFKVGQEDEFRKKEEKQKIVSNSEISKDASDLIDVEKLNPKIEIDMRYATADNFTNQVLYSSSKCYLRENVAERLDRVQKDLEYIGLGLKVWDAYRPLSVQRKMWKVFPDANFVADPARGSKHNRGASVDVTLVDLRTGEELPMPTEFDDLTERANVNYNDGVSEQAQQNRDFLQFIMKRNGFLSYKNEWWHFNDSEWESYPLLDVDFDDLFSYTPEIY